MDKQSLIREMKIFVGGSGKCFISVSQIAKFIGCSRDRMPELLEGLDYMKNGRGRQYFIPDVAERLMDKRHM